MADAVVFSVPGDRRVDWGGATSRLMSGSLLCLSPDGSFDASGIVLATVARQVVTPKSLPVGWRPQVLLDIDAASLLRFDPRVLYVMLESPVFFTAYSHVLAALQFLGQQAQNVPFARVLTGESTYPGLPSYLLDAARSNPLGTGRTGKGGKGGKGGKRGKGGKGGNDYSGDDFSGDDHDPPPIPDGVPPLSTSKGWHMQSVFPRYSESTGSEHWDPLAFSPQQSTPQIPSFMCDQPLDASQISAISLGLSSSVALIQGPPGCGKTFVGVKLALLLLANRHLRSPAPILFVCQTNHALDQMLEHVHEHEPNIIRVGGRSKSTILQVASLTVYS